MMAEEEKKLSRAERHAMKKKNKPKRRPKPTKDASK
jgi:hypothetical protein